MALDKEIKNAIDTYGKSIRTLQDFVQACRTATGMYIGAIGNRGFLTCIREIFQNAVDQLIDPVSPCDWIYIFYDPRTHKVIVEDNGLGLPFDDMIRILTSQHTSKNYDKQLYNFTSGLNGVGAKIVNAISSSFIAESYRYDGQARRLEMVEGYPTTKKPVSIPNPNKKQGTRIEFSPCYDVLGENITLDSNKVYKLVKRITSLTPIGSKVIFETIDDKGKLKREEIVNTDGIITDLIMKVKKPFIKPIIIGDNSNGERKIDLAFCYDSEGINGVPDPIENVTAFSNFCPTTEGTHINGCIKGITSWFVDYMNKIYLGQNTKNKLKIVAADVKCGLNIMISAAHLHPVFTGQAKEILSNEDMEPYAKTVTMQGLDEWSKNNPQDLQKLCKYFKELAEIRQKSDAAKVKITTKYNQSSLTGLPYKYVRPEGKEHLELVIVEGDSAKGTVVDGRCKKRQGIFPIRGKLPNAFAKSYNDFMGNAEIQAICRIVLGGPYRRNFDANKDVKLEKIIIMADADPDGDHIAALILRFFIMYMPQIIEAGKLYKAIPPLFGIEKGTGKDKKNIFFTKRADIIRYIQKIFVKDNEISDLNGKIISNKDLSVILMRNDDYLYEMNCICNRYAIEPRVLELILINHLNEKSPSYLKKQIKSEYRFVDMKEKNGTHIIEGIIDSKYNTLYVNDKLFQESEKILDILRQNDEVFFIMNGKKASLYDLMEAFESLSPSNLQRYKGLGEMTYKKLAESTLHPDGNRTLVRYTVDDVKEEIESIREYESNKKLILAEIDKVNRRDLLG